MGYESSKEKKIELFNKFLKELKEDYVKNYPGIRTLNYQLTIPLLCEQMKIYPKDAIKFIEMSIQKGELEEKREILLSEKIRKELDIQIEKNKPDIEKEIKESHL